MQICFMKPGDTLSALFAELRHRAGTAASPYLWVTNLWPPRSRNYLQIEFQFAWNGSSTKKGCAMCVTQNETEKALF